MVGMELTPIFYHERGRAAMSNEELAAKIQQGERELIPELWNQVERFVSQQAGICARRLEGFGGATEEDLYQSGFLALVDAVDSFDSQVGKSFIGWLALCLQTSFAEAGGYRSKRQARDPLHAARSIYDPLSNDTVEEMDAVENRIWNEQLRKTLTAALGQLPKAERDVVEAKYYMGQTYREMGPNAQRLKDKAFSKLRRMASLRRFIELRTPYYHHVGVNRFNSTHTSAVEWIVMERERLWNALCDSTES